MGVKKLQGYIESGDFLKPRCFRESKLIIDGCNLYYYLYFRSNLDQAHGGDYVEFEKIVTQFFRNLQICDIKPYVVLDGGTDVSDKKFETMKTRCQERIKKSNALSRGRSGEILPTLVKHVFKQVLWKLGVPFIQCLAEADWEAAALANEWNCPVLSNDSDFYIFSLKRGFLPITHFQWRTVRQLRHNSKHFIPSKLYHVDNLCSAFNRMNKYNLSLFAVILGNDYTELDKSAFPNFSKFSTRPGGTAQLDGVLVWLSQFPSPKEAIAALLSPLGKNRKAANIQTTIYQGMKEYRLNTSSISQFLMSGEPQTVPPGPLQKLPVWTLKPLAEGKLSSTIIDVLTLQRVMLNVQVEDFSLSSSNETSRPIREVMYGILLCSRWQEVRKGSTSSGKHQEADIEEYDRDEMELISSMVPAVLPRCVVTDLQLDSLWEEPADFRLQVLLDALDVSPLFNSLLIPANLQLAVYVTIFWLKQAQPKPRAEMFWALLIGLVYDQLCKEHRTAIEANTVILRLKNLQDRKSKTLLELELAHTFCQWQACLKDSYNLNQLLNQPVPEPELARLYSGSLLHAVAHELMGGIEPESLLTGASFAVDLYRNLEATVKRELKVDFIIRMQMRMEQRGWRAQHDPADELNEQFLHLKADEEVDGDGDKIYEETCRARTRHIRRAHTVDPRAKKSERVKWL